MNRCPWPTPGNKKGGQITDPAAVEYCGCRDGAFNFLIGQVMKATRGKANPQLVNAMLKKLMTAF